jgi:hypothetical protein
VHLVTGAILAKAPLCERSTNQDEHIEKPNRRQVDGHAVVIVVPLSSKDALASTLRAALEVGA